MHEAMCHRWAADTKDETGMLRLRSKHRHVSVLEHAIQSTQIPNVSHHKAATAWHHHAHTHMHAKIYEFIYAQDHAHT